MRYRIKIVTFKNGRKDYFAQKKVWYVWTGLSYEGITGYSGECSSREHALQRIDLNYEGNADKVSIDFEYINIKG